MLEFETGDRCLTKLIFASEEFLIKFIDFLQGSELSKWNVKLRVWSASPENAGFIAIQLRLSFYELLKLYFYRWILFNLIEVLAQCEEFCKRVDRCLYRCNFLIVVFALFENALFDCQSFFWMALVCFGNNIFVQSLKPCYRFDYLVWCTLVFFLVHVWLVIKLVQKPCTFFEVADTIYKFRYLREY